MLNNSFVFNGISILSTDGKCCEALIESGSNVCVLISILDKYPGQEEIIVRITYALGNILASNENARHQVILFFSLKFLSPEIVVICMFLYYCSYTTRVALWGRF